MANNVARPRLIQPDGGDPHYDREDRRLPEMISEEWPEPPRPFGKSLMNHHKENPLFPGACRNQVVDYRLVSAFSSHTQRRSPLTDAVSQSSPKTPAPV